MGLLEVLKVFHICTETATKFAVLARERNRSFYKTFSHGKGSLPACHFDIFSYVHPECFQTTDDPEAPYLLAGMFESQNRWRETDVSLIPALSPHNPFHPHPDQTPITHPPIPHSLNTWVTLAPLCDHFIICRQGACIVAIYSI